jgi:hypothetical protein
LAKRLIATIPQLKGLELLIPALTDTMILSRVLHSEEKGGFRLIEAGSAEFRFHWARGKQQGFASRYSLGREQPAGVIAKDVEFAVRC